MSAAQARMAWLIARDERDAIQAAIRQIRATHFRPAPLLSGMLPEAQRRTDEAYGTMVRLRDEEDERRWEEMLARTRPFVPPNDDPIWTMDLSMPAKRRSRQVREGQVTA